MRAELANTRSLSLRPETGDVSLRAVIAVGPKGDAGADGSNVLPTDTAISEAIENPASLTAGALSVTFAQKDSPTITGDATIERLGIGEGTPSVFVPEYGQVRIRADDVKIPAVDTSDIVGMQRNIIFEGDFTVRATVTITATGGTSDWTIGGQTATIASNASAATVLAALAALSSVGASFLTVTGGPGGTAPYVVSYAPKFIEYYGFRELTINGANLTGTGHTAAIAWVHKQNIDTGWTFGANDYITTDTVPGNGNVANFHGRISEVAIRNSGAYGSVIGASAEATWSTVTGAAAVDRMIGFLATAGRTKDGATPAGGNTVREVHSLYVNGITDGQVITDAVITDTSTTVTSASSRFKTLAHRGARATGIGIQANTYVLSVNETANTLTLSQPAVASGTITLTLAAIGSASVARTATFGYGCVEFLGRGLFKPGWKAEPAAQFYAFPGAVAGDHVVEIYDHTGALRGYVADAGYIAMKDNVVAREGDTNLHTAIGAVTEPGVGTYGGLRGGFDGSFNPDVLLYRLAADQWAIGVGDSLRLGRTTTALRPTASSRGAGAEMWDTDLNKRITSDGANWAVATLPAATWAASTTYLPGQAVKLPTGGLGYVTAARTSGSSWDATERDAWTFLPGGHVETLSSGTTWKAPVGVTQLTTADLLGGGAGGAGGGSATAAINQTGGGGGACGERVVLHALAVTPGTSYSCTIGAAGTAGTGGAAAGNNPGVVGTKGGDTALVIAGTTYKAGGGGAAAAPAGNSTITSGVGAAGGAAWTATYVMAPGQGGSSGGGFGSPPAPLAGVTGGSGGGTANGTLGGGAGNARTSVAGAVASVSAGASGTSSGLTGTTATQPGCGGGGGGGGCAGGAGGNGGAGAAGQIVLEF